jgi:hypothetical protein
MYEGRGGFWNRAGRRSGGDRPIVIAGSPEVECSGCHTKTPFGLLPQHVLCGVPHKSCPECRGVLFVQKNGQWIGAAQFMAKTS